MVQEGNMVMLSQKDYEDLLEYRQKWFEKERREKQGIKREMPPELKDMLMKIGELSSCGYVRSYYDSEAPDEYQYADSTMIYNFFCTAEEVAYALLEENIECAEDLIREYAEDVKSEDD